MSNNGYTLEQCLALASQGAGNAKYWLEKAAEVAGRSSASGEISVLKQDAETLVELIRMKAGWQK